MIVGSTAVTRFSCSSSCMFGYVAEFPYLGSGVQPTMLDIDVVRVYLRCFEPEVSAREPAVSSGIPGGKRPATSPGRGGDRRGVLWGGPILSGLGQGAGEV